jgi:hypothetical protein
MEGIGIYPKPGNGMIYDSIYVIIHREHITRLIPFLTRELLSLISWANIRILLSVQIRRLN